MGNPLAGLWDKIARFGTGGRGDGAGDGTPPHPRGIGLQRPQWAKHESLAGSGDVALEERAALAAAHERAAFGSNPATGNLFRPEPPRASPESVHPPRWLWRALLMAVIAVFGAILTWYAMRSLQGLLVNLLIAVFIALALEPPTLWLVSKGWKRSAAAATSLFGALIAMIAMFSLFGNLFVRQLIQLVQSLPDLYDELRNFVAQRWDTTLPEADELFKNAWTKWGDNVTDSAISVGTALATGLFAFLTIMLVTFYLLEAGPKFRKSVCQFMQPKRQIELLWMWEVTQSKVAGFLNSRVILALASSTAAFIFLTIIKTPYSLPLALFLGVVSQFIPTIGTYIGGALPVLVALSAQGLSRGIAVLVFIIAYQQVENLWLSPKISGKALEMNPAMSFVVVIAFGSVFGALGAFLALPIAATIQAIGTTYLRRHELVESALLHDPGEEWSPKDDDGQPGAAADAAVAAAPPVAAPDGAGSAAGDGDAPGADSSGTSADAGD